MLYDSPKLRLRRLLHRWTDPLRSLPNHRRALQRLATLPDGEYSTGINVPYTAQFASPARIHAYIHEGFHGRNDPNWPTFGAPDAETYHFWAHRACAIACLKMAIEAFTTTAPVTMWHLISEGIELGGYRTHDAAGRFVDEGWFYQALVKLGERYGLAVNGASNASYLDVCASILDGWLVAPAVTPAIGERDRLRGYDGHFILAYGFHWQDKRPESITIHNPSGRLAELQAGAVIPAARFRAAFAHRYMAFRPALGEPFQIQEDCLNHSIQTSIIAQLEREFSIPQRILAVGEVG